MTTNITARDAADEAEVLLVAWLENCAHYEHDEDPDEAARYSRIEAGARLLNAAPDLLAALQRIAELDTATRQNYNGDPEMHSIPGTFARIARAAIARATGGAA